MPEERSHALGVLLGFAVLGAIVGLVAYAVTSSHESPAVAPAATSAPAKPVKPAAAAVAAEPVKPAGEEEETAA